MSKRAGIALATLVALGVALSVLLGGHSLQNAYRGIMGHLQPQDTSQDPAQAPTPAPDAKPQAGQNSPASSDNDPAVPVEMLDSALESATASIDVPEGIQSSQIPEENGLHWFLIAAEQMPEFQTDEYNEYYQAARDNYLDNGWQEDPKMLEILDRCQASFEAIRKGLATANVSFPPADVEEPLPYLAKWRELARLMTIQAGMHASRGNYDTALDELATVLEFGAESSRDGLIITHLVGGVIQDIAIRQLAKVLQSPGVSAEQCRNIIARVSALEPKIPSMADTIRVEAEMFDVTYQRNSSSPDFGKTIAGQVFGEAGIDASDEQCRKMYQELAATAYTAASLLEAPFHSFDNAAFQSLAATNPLTKHVVSLYSRLNEMEARERFRRSGITLVAAIETYRHESGAYPRSLDELAPTVIHQLPADPFTGLSFHYVRQAGAYRLYSTGPNMRDDGGRGQQWNFKEDDYVIAGGAGIHH